MPECTMMKTVLCLFTACLMLSACSKEEEPEPQVIITGTQPKETPAKELRQAGSMHETGRSFERDIHITRRKYDRLEKELETSSRELEKDITDMKRKGDRLKKDAETRYEKSSDTFESDMRKKQNELKSKLKE